MMESYADKMAALRAVYEKKAAATEATARENESRATTMVADLWSLYTGAAINEEDVTVLMQLKQIAERKCGRA